MRVKYISVLEGKLSHAQRMIDKEKQKRREVEIYMSALEKNLYHVGDTLVAELGKEAYKKYPLLYVFGNNPEANGDHAESRTSTMSEVANSTGSLFSDLSYSRCEDDLDLTETNCGKIWKKHRPSLPAPGNPNSTNKRQSLAFMQTNILNNHIEKSNMAGTGTVKMNTVGADGMPQSTKIDTNDGTVNAVSQGLLHSVTPSVSKGSDMLDINSLCDIRSNLLTPQATGSSVGSFFPLGLKILNNRRHIFCMKTVIFLENCDHCGKRIKFGKMVMKCQDCRASCHPECKEYVPLPCVPVSKTILACQQGERGTISDYAPSTAPMVPSLIVHCVNEVDLRGLNEVGIYRIPGSEKDIRELKEKFLQGKGVPNLSKLDIHLVCGTIKYFLRSLREPLVTNSLWHDFAKAAENPDPDDSRALMYQAISELPQPNRDTLAFLILHLQRVAESPDCRMPVANLAKVFGPSIVGSCSLDCRATQMLKEVKKQVTVTENLINIPCDYWANFFKVDSGLVSNSPLSAATVRMLPDCVRTMKNSFTPAHGFIGRRRRYFATLSKKLF
ncbi:hypothetical protein B7P43_G17870 [Cryptotermes secundus]|nr:rac GTPase-activating protein 1 isoform X2 [Cryptotermes secundus]XP_023702613.1 rac GTPase-activating protein 1 isoform X2 [Cryptotermes secundus]PNF38684.1 hypothetical protein B7P43_G17870 [Cryptotermes secundus]PNF38689.1 hypothetical protein B7P43_G17870 [Cryptotermes secundus]